MSGDRRDEWIVVTEDARTLPVIEILTGRGFVTGKSGSGKSVLAGTTVYTDVGRKPIESVTRGERVLSLNPTDYQAEYREVQATLAHEADNLLQITLEDGTRIAGTADHSFLTLDGLDIVPIQGSALEPGTWVPLARTLPSVERYSEISRETEPSDGDAPSLVEEGTPGSVPLDFEAGRAIGRTLVLETGDRAEPVKCGIAGRLARHRFDRDEADGLPNWLFETPASFRAGVIAGAGVDRPDPVFGDAAVAAGLKELLAQFGIASSIEFADAAIRLVVAPPFEPRLEAIHGGECDPAAVRAISTAPGGPEQADPIPGGSRMLDAESGGGPTVTNSMIGRHRFNRVPEREELSSRARRFGRSDILWRRVATVEELPGRHTVYDLDVRFSDNFIANGMFVHNSNTAGVLAEELLSNGYNLLIVDTEGEHYTLKEHFEILHVGGDDFADIEVSASHADRIARVAIEENVPVILDVSGYYDTADAQEVITAVLEHVYRLEKEARKPFLIMVEEMQEYLPQTGGSTDLAALLERIAKRGRKRGLGICGMSQRPSSVDKDFITQCDWMVWHRLTWETDVNVVRNILGADRAADVQDFAPGEGILMTDWDDTIETVQFKRKRTQDAGATPGLESYERPDLQAVGTELIRAIKGEGAAELNTDPDDRLAPADGDEMEITPTSDDSVEAEPVEEESADGSPAPDGQLPAERHERELLRAEVEELRSILDGVEGRESAPTVGPSATDISRPSPPRPPRRPPDRSGVAGTIVEFGHMLVFLLRSAWYRMRLRYYNHRHL